MRTFSQKLLMIFAYDSNADLSRRAVVFELHGLSFREYLLFALSDERPLDGNVRETFFVNQLSVKHKVNTATKGDFLIDEKILFKIGGKNKKFDQIKDVAGSYLVTDNNEIGWGNRIPLWLFGMLY